VDIILGDDLIVPSPRVSSAIIMERSGLPVDDSKEECKKNKENAWRYQKKLQ